MASQPKKKDFFNGGRGVDLKEFEASGCTSPPLSPVPVAPQSPLTFGDSLPSRPLEFPQTLSASNSPPPLYPIHTSYGLYPPPYATHNPYLSAQLCPSAPSGAYPIPGMPYGAFDLNAAVHGAAGMASTSFSEAHLARSYGHHVGYPADCWGVQHPDRDNKNKDKDKEDCSQERDAAGAGATRQQKCSLCFNHGIVMEKKGHKWKCNFKDCNCERCLITKGRQKTMRDQQKLTRHLQKMQL